MPEPERCLAALELAAPFHAHFSARQRDALAERRAELGADTIDAAATALWQEHRTRISQRLSDSVDWLAPNDMANIVDYVRRAWRAGTNER
jgi:hypothetical protein